MKTKSCSSIMPVTENDKIINDGNDTTFAPNSLIRRRILKTMVPYASLNSSPVSSPSTVERRHVNLSAHSSPTSNHVYSNLIFANDESAVESDGLIELVSVNHSSDNNNDSKMVNMAPFDESNNIKHFARHSSKEENGTVNVNNNLVGFLNNDDANSVQSSNDNTPLLPLSGNIDEAELSLFSSSDQEKNTTVQSPNAEGAWLIGFQVFIPFLIAGCGTVGAGLVLDTVQHWQVFTEVPQIFILVPALLGLKGNLEMTLASRLSTLANLGRMDTKSERIKQIIGNLALIQAQAAVVAFLAAVFAIVLGWVPKGNFNWGNAFLLCASGLSTAAIASFVLGSVMVLVVILSRHFNINPDNVATPIAASLGDLTTLGLLSLISTVLNNAKDKEFWLAPMVIAFFILLCPLWIWISSRNPVTREVLISGWSPVIFSMLISSAGGFILEYTVARFRGIAVFQPVINGIGGNLVAVQASRLSTSLHQSSRLGVLPAHSPKTCFNPCEIFCRKHVNSVAARVLLFIVVPGHLIFMYMINYLRAGHTTITLMFAVVYLSAAVIQVASLLYICQWMVHAMWKRKVDPDNSAIPYLTALGDLLGTALLAIAFHILYRMSDQDSDLGE